LFDWLFEGSPAVYVLLGGVAGLLLAVWWRTRKRRWLYAAAGTLALIGVYFLLDRFVDTDKKQLRRTIEAMAAAVRARNVDAIFEHISEQFQSPRGASKRAFRDSVEQNIIRVTSFTVWDIKFPEEVSRARRTVRVDFSVKAEGPTLGNAQNVGFRCEATFDHDARLGWQLRGFRLFPVSSREEIILPF
jgi:hypothetical protein